MIDVRVSGIVKASPEVVLGFLADLANWPRWQHDMQSAELTSGAAGQPGAEYHYVSKAMGQTFDSTARLTRVDPTQVAFEGDWAGMIRPAGRYIIEPVPEGTRVTLNPHPEARGLGRLMEPLMGWMIKRLNERHLADLRTALEGH